MREYMEKSCPFCDGKVFVDAKSLSPYETNTVFICSWCGMKFEYTQTFYIYEQKNGSLLKVPHNPSPLEMWNQRKPVENVLGRLEEELKLADEEKERCARENKLQFDNAKGYATGIYNAIEFIKEEVG